MTNKTENKLVLDNRLHVSHESVGVVEMGSSNVLELEINPDGSSFQSQILFQNIVSPNLASTLVSRLMRLRYQVSIAVDESAAHAQLPRAAYNPSYVVDTVLRAFPIQSITDTLTLIINGATNTINSRVVVSALQRRFPKEFVFEELTECPCLPDNRTTLLADTLATALTSSQPMSKWENSGYATRTSIIPISDSAVGNVRTYVFEVSEPLIISPLTLHQNEVAFANVNTLSVQLQYQSLADMFVQALGATALVNTPTILSPRLQLTYLQVPAFVSIPRVVSYPFQNVVYFPKTITQASDFFNSDGDAESQNLSLQTDNIRFSSCPKLLYIFARPSIQTRAGGVAADCFASIGNYQSGNGGINIQFGNKSGLLSSSSAKTLWKMSKRNGLMTSWEDWSMGSGSVLVLDPVKDLSINVENGDTLPSESGYYNFQAQITINNRNFMYAGENGFGTTASIELQVVCVYEGVATITPETCVFNTGSLTDAEVKALISTAPVDGSMMSSEHVAPTIKGAGLFSNIKSLLGKGASGLKTASNVLSTITSHPAYGVAQKMLGGKMKK